MRAPTPQRITMALDLCELYGPEVDRACGVAEPAVDQWELGVLVPTPGQIAKLAGLTGLPVEFFYRPAPPLVGPVMVCMRGGKRGTRCRVLPEPEPAAVAVQPLLF